MIDLSSVCGHWLSGLLDVSVKTLALALLASACLWIGRVRSPALRHAVWATVLCGMLGLPFFSTMFPGIVLGVLPSSPKETTATQASLPMTPEQTPAGAAPSEEARNLEVATARRDPLAQTDRSSRSNSAITQNATRRVGWTVIAFGAYLAGVLVLVVRLFLGMAGCHRIVRASRVIAVDGLAESCSSSVGRLLLRYRVQVLVCSKVRGPVTLGWWHPKILLPPDSQGWGFVKREAVLAHELAHVARRDAFFIQLGAISQCFYWFHPLAWLVPKRMASLSERACDDRAIALTGAPIPYARCLLEFAATMVDRHGGVALGTISMANTGDLGRRIEAVLDRKRAIAQPLTSRALALLLTLAVLVIPAVAALRVGARAPGGSVGPNQTGSQSSASDGKTINVHGIVLDPDGRPVSGAKLYVTEEPEPDRVSPPPIARATTGPDGRFSFDGPRIELERSSPWAQSLEHPAVVAIADGFGPGFGLAAGESKAYTIRLARDDVPIEGRIVNSDGQPVAGARIQVASILWIPEGDLTRWRDALLAGEAAYPARGRFLKIWSSLAVATLLPTTTTGANGDFTLRGVGRERIAGILIEEPSIRTTIEHVVTRREPALRVPSFPPRSISYSVTYYGAQFGHVAEPSRPITGVVRDKSTGKPIAGAVVRGTGAIGEAYRFVQTTTDNEGRYRLTGLETPTKWSADRRIHDEVMALAPEGQPYLTVVQSTIEPMETPTLTRDFALKRGIWIKGRVIDKTTGQPHRASVDYYVFKDNPHAPEATTRLSLGHFRTTAEGAFRLVGLPGHGLLCARARNEDYRMGVGAERIKEKKMQIGIETIAVLPQYIMVNNFHVLSEINPPDDAEDATFELALDRGEIVKGRVLDPEGRPLAGAQVRGLSDWWDTWGKPLPTAEFEVTGLAPGDVRLVVFLHRGRRLAGSMILRGKVQGPIEVKLVPWGTVTGRLLDANGQPQAGVELGGPENQNRRIEAGPGSLPENVKTDAGGRFRAEGLAPGLIYNLHILGNGGFFGAVATDLTIKEGETQDLGDVKKRDQ